MKILENGIAVLEEDTHISRWVEEGGVLCHDGCVPMFILPHIPVGGTVVDGGAFIGDHTCAYLEKVGPNGTVLAFEPNPKAFKCLAHNCPKAELYPVALGSRMSSARFLEHENAGASSLTIDAENKDVSVITLDSIKLDRLDFMKLDLEGYECEALQGAVNTIGKFRPVMVIEMMDGHLRRQGASSRELMEMIVVLGYNFRNLILGTSINGPQVDLLCTPKK